MTYPTAHHLPTAPYVLWQGEEMGISEQELRYYHGQIRDHFATRFTQVSSKW